MLSNTNSVGFSKNWAQCRRHILLDKLPCVCLWAKYNTVEQEIGSNYIKCG